MGNPIISNSHARDLNSLAESVRELSRALTRDRSDLPPSYLRDARYRAAYVNYFLPANLSKVHVPLRELTLHPGNLLSGDRLQVLDLGSGPGTAFLGALQFFGREEKQPFLEVTAVDHVRENLAEAERLFRGAGVPPGRASLATRCARVETVAERSGGPFGLILLSNVVNELALGEEDRIAKRTLFVAKVLQHLLAQDGSCIIIEPALRETSRELLMVRDGLVDAGYGVYAPCLVQGRCPALVHPGDWCHEERPWEPTPLVREIDRLIGLRKDALKFSYLVLRKDGRSLADACSATSFRVVSEPLVSKGKRELYLCGPGGRKLAMRQDKDASQDNADFGKLLRGDIAELERPAIEERRFRITKETGVRVRGFPRDPSHPSK